MNCLLYPFPTVNLSYTHGATLWVYLLTYDVFSMRSSEIFVLLASILSFTAYHFHISYHNNKDKSHWKCRSICDFRTEACILQWLHTTAFYWSLCNNWNDSRHLLWKLWCCCLCLWGMFGWIMFHTKILFNGLKWFHTLFLALDEFLSGLFNLWEQNRTR